MWPNFSKRFGDDRAGDLIILLIKGFYRDIEYRFPREQKKNQLTGWTLGACVSSKRRITRATRTGEGKILIAAPSRGRGTQAVGVRL